METLTTLRTRIPELGFNDYVRALATLEDARAAGKPLRIAVLRSYTVEPIEPVLAVRLILDGYRPEFWFGGYNQYIQEAVDPQSALYAFRPDVVLMMIRLEEVLPDFVDGFGERSGAEWEERIAAKAAELGRLAERIAAASSAVVLIQGLTFAGGPHLGVFDAQTARGQQSLTQKLNAALAAACEPLRGVYLWDFDAFVRAKGYDNLFDAKMWYVSRNPFKQASYPAIANDLMRYLRSALGVMKKCVVVDLDNTLWGGVAGEDGLQGVALGHSYPGNCYRDFQKALLKLRDRGIILAINSKNNEADALEIIDQHPDMVLRRHHFAAIRINWQDKATNLRELAAELNIGVDSLIFLDDNPTECDLVRRECPECDVVQLPAKPYLLPAVPAALAGVDNIRLTDEDRRKGAMYQAQASRKQHEDHYSNMEDFLRSLDLEVSVEAATPFTIPRIAQLTQKTNQMNMTTRRYTEPQIQALAADRSSAVFAVSSKDRFGDEGIIGVVILRFAGDACTIDTLLLSCRVIGRGIEQLMLSVIADIAQARGVRYLRGEFFATAKNRPAAGFYERAGFAKDGDSTFVASLADQSFRAPSHIRCAFSASTPVARSC